MSPYRSAHASSCRCRRSKRTWCRLPTSGSPRGHGRSRSVFSVNRPESRRSPPCMLISIGKVRKNHDGMGRHTGITEVRRQGVAPDGLARRKVRRGRHGHVCPVCSHVKRIAHGHSEIVPAGMEMRRRMDDGFVNRYREINIFPLPRTGRMELTKLYKKYTLCLLAGCRNAARRAVPTESAPCRRPRALSLSRPDHYGAWPGRAPVRMKTLQ